MTFNVKASCGKVLIEFKSDDSITGKGFNATYEVIPHPSKWYPSTSPPSPSFSIFQPYAYLVIFFRSGLGLR